MMELKLGQVRRYYRSKACMIVLAFNDYEVIARPIEHDGPEFRRYKRDNFEDWYPEVVQ